MNANILNLVYAAAAVLGVAYVFIPKFRANLNQLARVTWNRFFNRQVDPRDKAKDDGEQAIDKQKKALKAAVALLSQQKESVVKLTATATLLITNLRQDMSVEETLEELNKTPEHAA